MFKEYFIKNLITAFGAVVFSLGLGYGLDLNAQSVAVISAGAYWLNCT